MRTAHGVGFLACVLLTVTRIATAADTSSNNDPLSVVKQLYAAFDRGDLPAVANLMSRDVVWIQYGPAYSLPFAGTFHGPAGVSLFFKRVDDTLTDVHAGQREFIVSGNDVVVPGWEESTVRSTGGHYRVNNVHEFKVIGGKITRFEEYIDNADVLEACMPADLARGKALFTTCAGCHGNDAEGRPAMHAPNLTGLGIPYVVQQLRQFSAAHRGNERDTYGFMMMGRASSLPGDRGIRDIALYLNSLPLQHASTTNAGNAVRGQAEYPACAACHGADAEGNPALGAPPLRQQDVAYMRTQLDHFSAGIRGADPADTGGLQMRAAVKVLPSAQAMDDVLAYINRRGEKTTAAVP